MFSKCWQHISKIYITKEYTFRNVTSPDPAPKGRTENLQLTYIPEMLAAYIQYKYIYILQNVHSLTLGPKGRTENLQLTYFPQMLAAYIQYKYMYMLQNVHFVTRIQYQNMNSI